MSYGTLTKISKKQLQRVELCTSNHCLTFLHSPVVTKLCLYVRIPPWSEEVSLSVYVSLMMKELEKYDTNCLSLKPVERKSIITKIVQ